MELRPYQIKSIEAIKSWGKAFDSWDDKDIAEFYSQWSEETFAAGWIACGEKMFYEYATTLPIDAMRKRLTTS